MAKQYDWWEAHFAVWTKNIEGHLGHNDWRVPSIEELISLLDFSKVNPASRLSDTVPSRYWSSTPFAKDADFAWYVSFRYGDVDNYFKTGNYYVRAVRSGPNGLEWGETLTESHAM